MTEDKDITFERLREKTTSLLNSKSKEADVARRDPKFTITIVMISYAVIALIKIGLMIEKHLKEQNQIEEGVNTDEQPGPHFPTE